MKIQLEDYVVIKATSHIGVVKEISTDPLMYHVLTVGESRSFSEDEIMPLRPSQVHLLDAALTAVARTIDRYHDDDEAYGPVYDKDGQIIYSSAAAAVLRILSFPTLIVEMGKAGERILRLEQIIEELQAQR